MAPIRFPDTEITPNYQLQITPNYQQKMQRWLCSQKWSKQRWGKRTTTFTLSRRSNPKLNRKPGKATKFREVLSSCQTKTNISASWKLKVQRNCGQFWHPQFRFKTVCLSLYPKILAAPNHELLNLGFPHQRVNVVVRSLVGLGKSAQFEVQDSRHQLGFTWMKAPCQCHIFPI